MLAWLLVLILGERGPSTGPGDVEDDEAEAEPCCSVAIAVLIVVAIVCLFVQL